MSAISVDFLTILLPSYLFFYMAIRLYVRNRTSQLHQLASFLMVSLLLYFVGEYTKSALFPHQWEAYIVLLVNAPMLLLTISLLVHICLLVSGPMRRWKRRSIPFIYLSPFTLLGLMLMLYSPSKLYNIDVKDGPSPLHPALLALALTFVGGYIVLSVMILLLSWIRSKEPRRKRQLLHLLMGLLLLFGWLFTVTVLLQLTVLTSPEAMSFYFTGLFVWVLGIQRVIQKVDFLPDFHKRFITLFHSTPTAIMLIDWRGQIREMNPSAKRMIHGLQGSTEPMDAASHLFFADGSTLAEQLPKFQAAQNEWVNWEMTLRRGGQKRADLIVHMDRLIEADESMLVLHLTDVTVLKETQRRLQESEQNYRYLAHHDTLTGLCNRAYIQQQVEEKVAWGEPFAFVLIDLDDFKTINDRRGHLAGDGYLAHIAAQLKQHAQNGDILGRIGGDEFVVIVPLDAGRPEDCEEAARSRLLPLSEHPFRYKGTSIPIAFSAGVSQYPSDADNLTDLMHLADEAMYTVKRSGKNNIAVYSPALPPTASSSSSSS